MQVKHTLPHTGAVVYDQPERIADALLRRYLAGSYHQVAQQGLLLITGIDQPGNRLFRDHQDMHGGLGVDVPERQAQIILVNDIRRNFPPDDFRKNCLCHGGYYSDYGPPIPAQAGIQSEKLFLAYRIPAFDRMIKEDKRFGHL